MSGNATRSGDFGPNENTYVLQQDEIVELRIHGSAGGQSFEARFCSSLTKYFGRPYPVRQRGVIYASS